MKSRLRANPADVNSAVERDPEIDFNDYLNGLGSKDKKSDKRRQKPEGDNIGSKVRKLSFVSAFCIGIAVFSAVFGAWSYMQAKNETASLSSNTSEVFVAKSGVQKGQTIEKSNLTTMLVPETLLVGDAISSDKPSDLIGRVSSCFIPAGAQISASYLSGNVPGASLASILEPGTQAVSVLVDQRNGIANLLQIGDRVTVVHTNSDPMGYAQGDVLATSLRIIALDSSVSEKPDSYTCVTVQAAGDEAIAISSAQASGGVSLILESQEDKSPDEKDLP